MVPIGAGRGWHAKIAAHCAGRRAWPVAGHSGMHRFARATVVFASASGLVTTAFVLVEPLRHWVEDSLRHAWREPVYVGRMLSRAQIAEAVYDGALFNLFVRLADAFDIHPDPAYDVAGVPGALEQP